MKRRIALILFAVILAVCLVSCTAYAEDFTYGTSYSLEIKGGRASYSQKAIENYLSHSDGLFSTSVKTSDISRINAADKNIPIDITYETAEILDEVFNLHNQLPEFNPAIFPLVELWGFSPDTFTGVADRIPNSEDVASLLPYCSTEMFILDKEKLTVTKKAAEAKLDLGAYLKGKAADDAAYICIENKATDYIINIGGTLKISGSETVYISNPRGSGYCGKFQLVNSACSTSGDYFRYYIFDSVRYNHIIGSNGYPSGLDLAEPIISATVVGESAAVTDVLSTYLLIKGLDGLKVVEVLGYSAFAVTDSGIYTVGSIDFETV